MTRLIRRMVSVVVSGEEEGPSAFQDDGETYRVCSVVDAWREAGAWWDGNAGYQMWRVLTDNGAVFDLEHSSGRWWIYRIWD